MLRLVGAVLLASGCWQAPHARAPANRAAVQDATSTRRALVTRVVDATTEEPVSGAMVIVVRQDVTPSDIDVLRWQQVADGHGMLVDELVVSSGRCDGAGKVTLPAPPKGTYEVVVLGRDYVPLHGVGALRVTDEMPRDPFGPIRLLKKPVQ